MDEPVGRTWLRGCDLVLCHKIGYGESAAAYRYGKSGGIPSDVPGFRGTDKKCTAPIFWMALRRHGGADAYQCAAALRYDGEGRCILIDSIGAGDVRHLGPGC